MKNSKWILLIAVIIVFQSCGNKNEKNDAQEQSHTENVRADSNQTEASQERLSPADTARLNTGDWEMELSYSAPSVRGRKIWGDLVPYEKVWRSGANEATVFYSNKDLLINGDTLLAGRYSFFTIPGEKEWTVIFNEEWNQWGAYEYNPDKDILRTKVIPQRENMLTEKLEYKLIMEDSSSAILELKWEYVRLALPMKSIE